MVHPAFAAPVGDVHGHQRAEFVPVYAVVAVTDNAPVDVIGRDQGKMVWARRARVASDGTTEYPAEGQAFP